MPNPTSKTDATQVDIRNGRQQKADLEGSVRDMTPAPDPSDISSG